MGIDSIGNAAYSAMSQEGLSVSVLKKALDVEQTQGEAIVNLLNKSVPPPNSNSIKIDTYV